MSRGWGFVWEGLGKGSSIQASSSIRSSGSISVDILVMTRGGSGTETVWIGGKAVRGCLVMTRGGSGAETVWIGRKAVRGCLEDSASSFRGRGTSLWEVGVSFSLGGGS